MVLVGEAHACLLEPSAAFDPNIGGTVDHHLGDGVVLKQRLDRPVTERVVGDLLGEPFTICSGQPALLRKPLTDVSENHVPQRAL